MVMVAEVAALRCAPDQFYAVRLSQRMILPL